MNARLLLGYSDVKDSSENRESFKSMAEYFLLLEVFVGASVAVLNKIC